MDNDTYLIEIPEVQALNESFRVSRQKFCISFDYRWIEQLDDRKITTCCIIELPSKKIYSGATIKNSHDNGNKWIAYGWAYKRAVLQLWMIWCELDRTGMDFKHFWQLFRHALGENKIYLSERKAKYG
jgi:hypothetical protein